MSNGNEELKALIQSNARTIQGILEARASERLEREERMQRHEERMQQHEERMQRLEDTVERLTNVQEGVSRLLASLDDDRPTILRRLNSIENKSDQLLDN